MVCAVIAMVNSYLVGWEFPLAWVCVYGVAQALELVVFGPINAGKTETLPAWRTVLGCCVLALSAVIFGALAIPLWLLAGAFGGVTAVLLLNAAIINTVITSAGSRLVLACAGSPHFLYLAATPWFMNSLGASRPLQSAVTLASLVFCAYALLLWRSMDQTRQAEVRARQESERKRLEAEAAVAAQTSFVATVSHELRTPISAMMAGAAELGRGAQDASARNHAALIQDAGRMMKALLDDILDHAKLEAGRMTVEHVPFDLRQVTAQLIRFWTLEARKKGLKLRVEGAAQLPAWVEGDATRLRQVLNNLISNAVKFTGEGSITLRLSAWASEDDACAVRFQVVDTGQGMDADQIGRLFTPFEQAGAAAHHGGTGLGLAISRQLARLMGGHLTAFSVKGSGSVFTLALTFPLAEAPADAAPAAAPEPAPVAAEAHDVEPAEAVDEGRPVRILVADDHEINRRAVQLVLAPMGAAMTAVENGLLAVEAARTEAFDIIIMDVRMPEMDGREATRRIRAMAGPNQFTPVIAVTADTEDDDKAACRDAGMTAFVGKPIDPAKLVNTVIEALDQAAEEAEQAGRQVA